MAKVAAAPAQHFTLLAFVITVSAVSAYTNHSVGGSAGWFFNVAANTSSANYSVWAVSQTFSLGDYLIFKTNTNQTVIQTYNETVFESCSIDDALDSQFFEYGGGNEDFGDALTIPVPLTLEGLNYYFSSADDGVQCLNGMAFAIDVKHGKGLPSELNQTPPPPSAESPGAVTDLTPPVEVLGGSQPPGNGGFRSCVNLQVAINVLILFALTLVL